MINSDDKLQDVVEYVKQAIPSSLYSMPETMSSADFNIAFSAIEDNLTILYEKIRELSDINDYTRAFIVREIASRKEQYSALLRTIEDNAWSMIDKNFVAIEIPFVNKPTQACHDRDGSVLPLSSYADHVLIMASGEVAACIVTGAKRNQLLPCYRHNITELERQRPYRAFYVTDTIVPNGVQESVIVSFAEPITCNYLHIAVSNCKIEKVIGINESDTEIILNNTNGKFITQQTIKGLRIDISSSSYSIIQKAVSGQNEDAFVSLIHGEQESITAQTTIHDIEAKTAADAINRSFDAYTDQYLVWTEAVKETKRKNTIAYERKRELL